METLLAIVTGILFSAGLYCLLRRSLMKIIIGIMLLSQSGNLVVFIAGGLTSGRPAFVDAGHHALGSRAADPIPQALVLTAIVIGFGLVVFSLSLLVRAYEVLREDDLNAFDQTDQIS